MASKPIQFHRYGHGGPLVVLLHGGPGAAGEMAPLARQLSARFDVLEPLQRASEATPLTVAAHVAGLHDVLEKSLQSGPVRIVGFSWGAMLALTYAARHASDVERVVAVGCGTFDRKTRQVYQARMVERMDETTRRHVTQMQSLLASERDQTRRDELFTELGRAFTRVQAFEPMETDAAEAMHYDERAFREIWADVLSLQEEGLQPAEFCHITAPVTMLHGEADPHPGRLIYESLRPFIRKLAYVEIPQCGHKPWIERHAASAFYTTLLQRLT